MSSDDFTLMSQLIDIGVDLAPLQEWPVYGGGELDRSKVVTSSEIGYCPRKVKMDKEAYRQRFEAQGHVATGFTSRDDYGMMARGHSVEKWVVENLRRGADAPDQLLFTGDDQVSFVRGAQAGTPDGVWLLNGANFLTLEIKSIDPRTNWNKLPKKEHVKQVIQNTDLIAHNMELSPAGGLLLYVDASDFKKRKEFPVEFCEDTADLLCGTAEEIMGTADPADLEPTGMYTGQCRYCAHKAPCSAMVMKQNEELRNDTSYAEAKGKFFG